MSKSSGEALFIGWCILALTLRLLKTPKNSEDSGEVLQYAAFHRGLRRRRPIICNIGQQPLDKKYIAIKIIRPVFYLMFSFRSQSTIFQIDLDI